MMMEESLLQMCVRERRTKREEGGEGAGRKGGESGRAESRALPRCAETL